MSELALVDTGPLVAFFDASDEFHPWAADALRGLRGPLLTCEPVIAETTYLLRRMPAAQDALLGWLGRGSLKVEFDLAQDVAGVRRLMKKYRDQPMSLADACLVRMAETIEGHAICTLDEDFRLYRKDGGAEIELVMPGRS